MTAVAFLLAEMARRGLRVYATRRFEDQQVIGFDWKLQAAVPWAGEENRPEDWDEWTDDWEPAAGGMAKGIREMQWVFLWGVSGKLSGHDWLMCDTCGEAQLLPRARGTASGRKKCLMTLRCDGYMCRAPDIFCVIKKNPPKTRKVRTGPTKLRGHSQEIRDEALALVDSGMSQSAAMRIMAARHPDTCAKLSVSAISTWKLRRDRHRGSF